MKKNTKLLLGLAAVAGAYWLWKKNSAPKAEIYYAEEPIKSPAPPNSYPERDKYGMPRVVYNMPTPTVDEYGLVIRE